VTQQDDIFDDPDTFCGIGDDWDLLLLKMIRGSVLSYFENFSDDLEQAAIR